MKWFLFLIILGGVIYMAYSTYSDAHDQLASSALDRERVAHDIDTVRGTVDETSETLSATKDIFSE